MKRNNTLALKDRPKADEPSTSPPPFDPGLSAEIDALQDDRDAVSDALHASMRRARKSPLVRAWFLEGAGLLGKLDAGLRSCRLDVGL